MKQTAKRCLSFFMLTVLFLFAILPACAEEEEEKNPFPDVSNVRNVYVYNFENDLVMYTKNAEDIVYPTSTVKMMTGLVAIEHLSGRLDEKVTVKKEMLKNVTGNRIGLEAGEAVTVRDLLYATLSAGANDAANVLAFTVAGGVDEFVTLMNKKAVELGALDTHYTNPNGMHDERMLTSTLDTAKIAKEAYKSELFMEITSTAKYVMSEGTSTQRNVYNRNYLISKNKEIKYYYQGARGMNSGSTNEGGYSLVTTVQSNGLSYLCVIMGGGYDEASDTIYSYTTAKELLEWAKGAYSYINVIDTSKLVYELPVTLSNSVDYVALMPASTLELFLPADLDPETDLKYNFKLTTESLEAPVYEGQVVGFLTVSQGDTPLGMVDLVTKNGVERNEFLYVLNSIKQFTKSRFFIAALVCAIVLSFAYIFGTAIYRARAPRRRRRYRR